MQKDECVGKVVLYNRADCCANRLEGAIVRVGSNTEYGQNAECQSRVPASPGSRIEIECNLSGQYISVELPRPDFLTLCEVEATMSTSCKKPAPSEISLIGKPTSQSSTLDAMSNSDHAVDGNTNGYYFRGSCTHTARSNVGNPWWAVDMQKDECVGKVVLYNRVDCCADRLRGAIVRVGSNTEYGQNAECQRRVNASKAAKRIEIECNLSGQYISVELPKWNFLTLCEVKAIPCSGNDKRMSEETLLLNWLKRELETDNE
ncbi:pentraxin fusion protein-like [Amphiura filiformis]|uniref:pentraxin fusion protein-like n=1 Tax=Amphiura filiformis TaxID=82378 RepID=UPI003B20BBEF